MFRACEMCAFGHPKSCDRLPDANELVLALNRFADIPDRLVTDVAAEYQVERLERSFCIEINSGRHRNEILSVRHIWPQEKKAGGRAGHAKDA